MPPKPSSSKAAKHQSSNKGALDAINAYLSQKPDLDQLIREAKENPRWSLPEKRQTEYDLKIKEAVREVLIERSKQAEGTGQTITMPSHPKDGSGGFTLHVHGVMLTPLKSLAARMQKIQSRQT